MGRLEEDLKAFGIRPEECRETAQKAGRWFLVVEDGPEFLMRKSPDAERSDAAKRYAAVAGANATHTVDTNNSRKGPGKGFDGGEGVA